VEVEELQTTFKRMEQTYHWKHIPIPKILGATNEGNSTRNPYLGELISTQIGRDMG
jgi:hypothetical protein